MGEEGKYGRTKRKEKTRLIHLPAFKKKKKKKIFTYHINENIAYFINLMLSSIKNHNRIAELMQLSPAANRRKCSIILILLS